jgi:hypothetical protein
MEMSPKTIAVMPWSVSGLRSIRGDGVEELLLDGRFFFPMSENDTTF